MNTFRAIILGAPGSGKGTISARIVRKFDMVHVSSGNLLRQNIAIGSKFGLEAKKFMDAGKLVPDEIMFNVIASELKKYSKENWLLDGFPRTRNQAEQLFEREPVNVAINLIVPFDIIIERIKGRWIHLPSGRVYNTDYNAPKVPGKDDVTGEPLIQRKDDLPEAVQKRLEVYEANFNPILEFYKSEGILEEFKGKTSDEIWPYVFKLLSTYLTPEVQETSKN
uniref:GTP:AMP phosphotransferase, mitochondrial n=1 Tax=Graphocephala atropunctata TaxID=36148 RepID=A0A1B6LWM4_9HEMI